MGSIGWSIVHPIRGAFRSIRLNVTACGLAAWRGFDPITSPGASLRACRRIPSLVIAAFVRARAPIAMVIAAAHVLKKLATDAAGLAERLTRRLAT